MARITIILIAVLSLSSSAMSEIFQSRGFSFSGLYRLSYDNNILRYSDRDYNNAQDGTERAPSPVTTLDDLRNDLRFTANYRFKLLNNTGRLTGSLNFAPYVVNPINNFGWVSLTYKQAFLKDWDFLLNHFYEPYYFLRDYRDVHTGEDRHCDFALSKSIVKLYYQPLKLIELFGWGETKTYAYNEYFTEYDGDRTELGGGVTFRSGNWRILGSYSLGTFNNLGFSSDALTPPGVTEEDTETGEGDYEEDTYEFSVYYTLQYAARSLQAKLSSTFNDRYYTTARSPDLDPIHHGRHDLAGTVEVSLELKFTDKITLEPGVTHFFRNSEASMPIVEEVKSYQRWVTWLEVGYDF